MNRLILAVGLCFFLVQASAAAAGPRAPGDLLWSSHYSEGSSSGEVPSDMAASPDGSKLFVVGSTTFGGAHSYVVVAYDAASGHQAWARHYPTGSSIGFAHVAVSPDGSKVFLGADRSWPGTQFSADVAAFDAATGAPLWISRFRGPENASGMFDIATSPDGATVYLTGDSFAPTLLYEMITIAYDASTGTRLWLAREPGLGSGGMQGFAVAASPTGDRVFVTGSNYGGTESPNYVTVGYDAASGSKLWMTVYDGPGGGGSDYPRDVVVSPDGSRVFVTGVSPKASGGVDATTLALNAATGAQLWLDRFDSGHADATNHAVVSPDGATVVVAGSTVVALEAATGAERWSATKRHLAYGGVAVSTDSSTVYAAGGLAQPLLARESYMTKAFDIDTGAVLWQDQSDQSPCSYGYDLALAPDGSRVYVTGIVPDLVSGCGSEFSTEDFGTVAYSAA